MSEYHINPEKTKFLEEAIKLKLSDQEEDMQNYSILTVYGFLRNTDVRLSCNRGNRLYGYFG